MTITKPFANHEEIFLIDNREKIKYVFRQSLTSQDLKDISFTYDIGLMMKFL